jgi:hypothetical protein
MFLRLASLDHHIGIADNTTVQADGTASSVETFIPNRIKNADVLYT